MSSKGINPHFPGSPGVGILGWIGRLAAVFAAFVAAVLVFNFWIMPVLVRSGKSVEVPSVTEMTVAEAVRKLGDAGLAVQDTVNRQHPSLPAGIIMDQDPVAGREVKPERRVRLVVSGGGRAHSVPDIQGQTLRFARILVSQEGYLLEDVVQVHDRETQRGFVIASDPPAGTTLEPGAPVSLLVSAGPPALEWVLPDFRGESIDRIEEELQHAGFDVTTTIRERDSFVSWRTEVLETDPPPGSKVQVGDPILLIGG